MAPMCQDLCNDMSTTTDHVHGKAKSLPHMLDITTSQVIYVESYIHVTGRSDTNYVEVVEK